MKKYLMYAVIFIAIVGNGLIGYFAGLKNAPKAICLNIPDAKAQQCRANDEVGEYFDFVYFVQDENKKDQAILGIFNEAKSIIIDMDKMLDMRVDDIYVYIQYDNSNYDLKKFRNKYLIQDIVRIEDE